jgi:hypothetical protein
MVTDRRARLAVAATLGLAVLVPAGCTAAGGGTGTPTPAVQAATPGAVRTPPAVAKDQQFAFDEIAEFPDGIEVEMAGTVASKAEDTIRGADATQGEMVTVSIRIGNNTEVPYDVRRFSVTATYGPGTPAPLVLDTVGELQTGFSGQVAPADETVAPFGFAVPFAQLGKVTYVVDPGDDEHEAVSFTGKVERQ